MLVAFDEEDGATLAEDGHVEAVVEGSGLRREDVVIPGGGGRVAGAHPDDWGAGA